MGDAVCLTDEPEMKTVSHTSLMKVATDDLRNFGVNFCGIAIPAVGPKEKIVERLLTHQALRGRGADRLAELVSQAAKKAKMKSEEKTAKRAVDEANARLETANLNRDAAQRALQAAMSMVLREMQAAADAETAYERAQTNTANFS